MSEATRALLVNVGMALVIAAIVALFIGAALLAVSSRTWNP